MIECLPWLINDREENKKKEEWNQLDKPVVSIVYVHYAYTTMDCYSLVHTYESNKYTFHESSSGVVSLGLGTVFRLRVVLLINFNEFFIPKCSCYSL